MTRKLYSFSIKCEKCNTDINTKITSDEMVMYLVKNAFIHSRHAGSSIHIDAGIDITEFKDVDITRPMTKYLQTLESIPLVGAEIGILNGMNSSNILENLKIKRLYLIDPWEVYKEWNLNENTTIPQNPNKLENLYKEFTDKEEKERQYQSLKEFELNHNNVTIIRKRSDEAYKDIPDNSLDFVYIDGNHAYKYVKKDIVLYYPKVKIGGLIGGHDFDIKHDGVVRAVLEFKRKSGLQLNGSNIDWWFIKK